jgi:hypothetical protein
MVDIRSDSGGAHSADQRMPGEIESERNESPANGVTLLAPAAPDLDDVDVAPRL